MPRRTDDDLLDVLRTLSEELGRPPTHTELDEREALPSSTSYERRFGSWNAALEAAGLDTRSRGRSRRYTDAELIDFLQTFVNARDRLPPWRAFQEDTDMPSANIYKKRFGSWNAALEAAGYDPSEHTAGYTDPELLEGLNELAEELDRTPKIADLNDIESLPSSGTYYQRFGSWTNAVERAGLEPNRQRGLAREEMLEELHELVDIFEEPPDRSQIETDAPEALELYESRFGSWQDALEAAGYETNTADHESGDNEKMAGSIDDGSPSDVSAGDTANQEHGSLYSLEEVDRTMIETLEAGGGAFDADPLHTAAEVYTNYRAENGPEEHKWRLFGEVNDWLAENELSDDTVAKYVEQLEEANPSYPLMNWRNTANLGDAAADHPAELVSLFEELYEGTDPIATRVDQFRSGLRSLIGETVTSDGIGFLFAAYDVDGYAPYKDGVFRDFIDYFATPSQLELGSVGEKYAVFIECCETLADFLVNEGYLDEATPLDAQDFIYTIIEYEDQRYQFVLTYLWRYARRLDSMESTDDLLSALQGLPAPFLRNQATQYEGAEKVNRVRYEVLSQIIDTEPINYERIKTTEEDRHEKDIFKPWSDFGILIQPYYNFSRARIERYLGDLAAYVRTELDAEDLTDRVVTFQGQANFPQTVSGLGLHPSDRNHTESYQLWIDITPTRIWFGLYAGSDLDVSDQMYDTQEISDGSNLSLDTIIDHLRSVQPEFERLNESSMASQPTDKPDKLSRFPNIARQLQRTKQIVFYGPPGTGKTYHAVNFANWWIAEDGGDTDEQVQTVTFHPSFTYEDFLEGLTATAENGEVEYRIDDGVFKEFCNRARTAFEQADGSPSKYILVVDEINRGNLANVFGETITLIESDKRLGGDSAMETTLAHSGDDFGIPPNLYLLGTMNTADRSIALVDAALRRRFRFLSFPPEYDVLYEEFNFEDEIGAREAAAESSGGVSELQALSVLGLQEINRRIIEATSLDRGKQLGHSYLMGQDSEAGIVDAWRYEILPLLEEYYFGQFERLRSQLLEETSDQLFDWERQQVQDFSADDLREALRSLLDIEIE